MTSDQDQYDEPTGALNRTGFYQRVEEAITAAQTTGVSFAVCLLKLSGVR
jgi:GGDEF domain-containing protein